MGAPYKVLTPKTRKILRTVTVAVYEDGGITVSDLGGHAPARRYDRPKNAVNDIATRILAATERCK